MENAPVACLQDPDPIVSVRFQERLGIFIADMECFVDKLQWVTEQQVHQTQAIDDKSCMLVSAEEESHSSTCPSREGLLLQSTGSSQRDISPCSHAIRSSGQVYVSGRMGIPAKRHWAASSSGDLSSTGELSETDSDSDPMTDSNQQPGTASRLSCRKPGKEVHPGSISEAASKTLPNLPKVREGAMSLAIEIFKVDSIKGVPRTPSSKLLTNIWGTGAREDGLPRKQAKASTLEVCIENKLEKLLGRRRLSAAKYSTTR